MKTLTFDEKKRIADNYLNSICGLSWDELPDINSLHDAETKTEIKEMCDERLVETGFPFE
jgi:hypothetical protein